MPRLCTVHRSLLIESGVVFKVEGGYFALHGFLVVGVGAGEHELVGVEFVQFGVVAGHAYPPAVGEFALVEVESLIVVL